MMEAREEGARLRMAIRCAKAAQLIASLKSFPDRNLISKADDLLEEKELLLKEVRSLKMQVAREQLKYQRVKLCCVMEVFLQVMVVFCSLSLMLVLAFRLKFS